MKLLKMCSFGVAFSLLPVGSAMAQRPVSVLLTSADRGSVLSQQGAAQPWQAVTSGAGPVIHVEDHREFQTVKGFGFALTGGSAQLIHRMSPEARHKLLTELFSRSGSGVGVSYLRLTIGSSDLNDHVFTYDEMPSGQSDPKLDHFSLQEDETDVIPVLKEILAIAPNLRLMATPWTAPRWMKTNRAWKGGELSSQFYTAYAEYLTRYVKGMAEQGIELQAITIQNEPMNANNTPSMLMSSKEEAHFLREALGPAFQAAGLSTEILIWDHNCDHPEYPLDVLKDPEAAKFVTGSAFHLYGGDVSAMSQVHDAHPDKEIDFTEQMVIEGRGKTIRPVAQPFEKVIVGALRNWSRTVLLWNLASDPELGPHTPDGGCPMCQGAVTLDGDHVHRNIAYYAIAQISKLVPPGSVRIDSDEGQALGNVAFRRPDGKLVLFVCNNGESAQAFSIQWNGKSLAASAAPGTINTYIW